jgi:hypothetical protein
VTHEADIATYSSRDRRLQRRNPIPTAESPHRVASETLALAGRRKRHELFRHDADFFLRRFAVFISPSGPPPCNATPFNAGSRRAAAAATLTLTAFAQAADTRGSSPTPGHTIADDAMWGFFSQHGGSATPGDHPRSSP